MLLPLLQFGREYRGGDREPNVQRAQGQRTQREDAENRDWRVGTEATHTQRNHSQVQK